MIKINKVIKAQRTKLGLTQDKLAAYLDITKPTISKWENGSLMPDIQLLPKLAKLFNMSVDELLDYQDVLTKEDATHLCQHLSKQLTNHSYGTFLTAVKESCHNNNNEYSFLLSIIALLMNHIYYAENEEQCLDTIQFAQTLCDIVEEKSDSDELIKYAKCYRLAFQLYSADYSTIIDTVPDCSIKEGTAFFLADAYAQQGNLAKASSVIQVDMYQSLMLMSQQLQLILVRDLYEEISDIEQRFKALQQGFNINQLFPYINIGINLSLAKYYYQQTEYEQALEYLEDYCQCYERVVRNCNYQQDHFFNDIDMFLAKMPFGERLNIQNDRVARDFYRVVADEQRFAELWHNPQFQQIVKRLDFIYRQGIE